MEATPGRQFSLEELRSWIRVNNPPVIDMTDQQYSWLAHLARACVRTYEGIPINFLDEVRTPTA
jgi:hypothetical protein